MFWKTATPCVCIKQVKQLNIMESLKDSILDHPLMFLKAMEMVYLYCEVPLAQTLALNLRFGVYI